MTTVSTQALERLAVLVAEYDEHTERRRSPLLDEMDDLGGIPAAGELAGSDRREDRYVAARLMHLLPDESHVAPLGTLVHDADPEVAALARRALHGQVRSPAWHALVRRLAEDEESDAELAAAAARWLAEGARQR
jgi:hypothetical protein